METPARSLGVRKMQRDQFRTPLSSIPWKIHGRVIEVIGTVVEAHAPDCVVGSLAEIYPRDGSASIMAEVVGIRGDRVRMLPLSTLGGVSPGCSVSVIGVADSLPFHDSLLGRVVDPFLKPLDGDALEIDPNAERRPLDCAAPNPLGRNRISKTLSMGVRSIDSALTVGEGQRIGIMAGSGVGKSVLMGMIARGSSADINVIGLIGERGREVREFLERDLGKEALARSVVVVVTGDQSPLMRVRGAKVTTAIAEYFSAQGKSVLLMMDSLTRVAMAQREIGLATGEPPTTKGYTPSVFALLPRLLERTGPQLKNQGNITALYTVLVDSDDFNDPIADAARSILDGHINLSRALAAKGHFPAIEITTSTSRVMHDIVAKDHWQMAQHLRMLLGTYQENFDLIQIGAYQPGSNPTLDEAVSRMPMIDRFLKQDISEQSSLEQVLDLMPKVIGVA